MFSMFIVIKRQIRLSFWLLSDSKLRFTGNEEADAKNPKKFDKGNGEVIFANLFTKRFTAFQFVFLQTFFFYFLGKKGDASDSSEDKELLQIEKVAGM